MTISYVRYKLFFVFSQVGSAKVTGKDGGDIQKHISAIAKISILLKMYNQTMGRHFLPHFIATLGFGTIGSLILLVKFISNPLIVGFSILFLLLNGTNLFAVTTLCGRVHVMGTKLRNALVRQEFRRKITRKQLKSLRIPPVKVGSFYPIYRNTSLTVIAIIYTATTNLLISLKNF